MDRVDEERTRWWDHQQNAGNFDTGDTESPGPRTPFEEAPSGVTPDKSVAEASRSEADKRRLCAWYMRRPPALDRGCLDGSAAERSDFAECLASFPSCNAPVWRAEACMRRVADDPCKKERATAAACEGIGDCRWDKRRPRNP
jgi:hypothetical protein